LSARHVSEDTSLSGVHRHAAARSDASSANAEYVVIPESGAIVAKPESLSFAHAAATPFGALAALTFLRDVGRVKPGQRVLIYGASGAVGVFAVQLAKHFGAEVTAVCSTRNAQLVKSLGADAVIDYSTTNFLEVPGIYDVILDTVGGTSFSHCRSILAPNGRHVFLVQGLRELVQAIWTSLRAGKRVIAGVTSRDSKDNLLFVSHLAERGVVRPVIDRRYDLNEIGAAHQYVETGRKRGAVVIDV
jgi:NADPH:quinone reductase-like Zn-dependent oxidoreductase